MSSPLPSMDWGNEQRAGVHAAFNRWIASCTEDDYQKLMALREAVAPGDVCSIVKLVRACYARLELLEGLPASLVQLLQERNLPPPSSAAQAGEG
ncbi:hypothetical protein AVME950_00410 [Acidovorax sp. SUPP950]|uniref:hypothetical protein n=1 Tax=Acidovorax sp. SUPP950 TaxID=511901 RepID=UPI0023BE79A2|nr:hypothetical protein [Acidovorax sp. SUPP950]GKS73300.1 hypothetical protein AVME950_00410 [Acidovorax sp. SUPP950]